MQKFINRLKIIQFPWSKRIFKGYDLEGNMYFEEPSIKRGTNFSRRSIDYFDGRSSLSSYDPNIIPVQWQAWMRHTRGDAPTREELELDRSRLLETQRKVLELQEIDKKLIEQQDQIPIVRLILIVGSSRKLESKKMIYSYS